MRRTKHRRRFHTGRVISNRQRAYKREAPAWWGYGDRVFARDLERGRLRDSNAYFGCGRPRCLVCHWEKYMEPRRAREKRAWQREVAEQFA